jgi:hypothetical protein
MLEVLLRLATLLPYPFQDLGKWLCVPRFHVVCLFQVFLLSDDNLYIVYNSMTVFPKMWGKPDFSSPIFIVVIGKTFRFL